MLAADVVAVAAILAVLVVSIVVVVRQRAYDDEAADVAAWAQDRGVERVAWSADKREAVPALLDAGVVPVLVESSAPVQQYAIAQTGVVVADGGEQAPALVQDSHRFGDLTAYVIDLDAAASVPLAVGDTVSEEISRPYRYAPLHPSAVVLPGESFRRDLYLEPGRYEVTVEAFVGVDDEKGHTSLVVLFALLGGDVVGGGGIINNVVEEPLVVDIELPEGPSSAVRLAIGPVDGEGAPSALIHAWSVTRLADR